MTIICILSRVLRYRAAMLGTRLILLSLAGITVFGQAFAYQSISSTPHSPIKPLDDKNVNKSLIGKLLDLVDNPCAYSKDNGPEMIIIPAGRFEMGSPESEKGRSSRESPKHLVAIVHPFAIGRCEITVGQFRTFVNETGYVTSAESGNGCQLWQADNGHPSDKIRKELNWKNAGYHQDVNHPVVCVSWYDAQAYIRWLSERTGQHYRLPSEAEWEYAARAGSNTAYFWGDDPRMACDFANVGDLSQGRVPYWKVPTTDCDDHAQYTAPVAKYKPNAFGLYDMLGNVYEWTQDCEHSNYIRAPVDGHARDNFGSEPCSERITRGGAWGNTPTGPPKYRSAVRNYYVAGNAAAGIGFRIVRELQN